MTDETSKVTNGAFGALVVGIVRLDGWGDDRTTGTGGVEHVDTNGDLVNGYVPITGDVDDAGSFEGQPFTMVAVIAKDCTWDALKNKTLWETPDHLKNMRDSLAKAFETLMLASADVIIANCGLFMWMHSVGIVTPAMDQALKAMGNDAPPRPLVALSTLTMLPGYLPVYGLGASQRAVVERGGNQQSKAVVAIFTSDEDACLAILEKTEQLKGTNVFVHTDEDEEENKKKGGILVIGLNGKNVIGVDGEVQGFDIVTNGTPAFYDVLNPEMEKVAKGVKEHYPNVVMGIVECTEVGAYTDTIREAMSVPVFDPIQLAGIHMDTFLDHDYKQVGHQQRIDYIDQVLKCPVDPDNAMAYFIEIYKLGAEEDVEEPPKKKLKTEGHQHLSLHKLIDFAKAGRAEAKAALAGAMKKSDKGPRKGLSARKRHDMQQFKLMERLLNQAGDDDKLKEIHEKIMTRLSERRSRIHDLAKKHRNLLHGLWAKIKN
jgi:hypothetical protein